PRALAPRLAAPRHPAGVARALPRPLAGGATAARGQADGGGRPAVRPRTRNLPAPARVGAAGRERARVCGGHRPGDPHGLLGSAAAPDAASAPPLLDAAPLSSELPPPGAHPRKSHRHGPPPHRLLGPTPPPGHRSPGRIPCGSRLSHRKLEITAPSSLAHSRAFPNSTGPPTDAPARVSASG